VRIQPIPEHVFLVFWVELVVLVGVARLLGALMRRNGQPAVVGELAAGLLLGPSVFGKLAPGAARWLFPPHLVQSGMISAVAWVGIVMLLAVTGFETDLGLVRQLGSALASVAVLSIALPFALGLGLGFGLPHAFVGSSSRGVFAAFVATALSISSLPVIAKVLQELRLTRRNFGQLTLAAGMVNDVVGWLLLGVLASAARSGTVGFGRLGLTILAVALFLLGAFTLGQRIVDELLRSFRKRRPGMTSGLSITLLVVFAAGAITQALGVESVLGAFVAGIVLARSRYQDSRLMERVETMTNAVFAPVFFATAGLRVDLGLLGRADVLLFTAVVIAVASLGKLAGGYLGARLAGLPRQEGFALGVGLNARGALEIVVATVGLGLGVLNTRMYTVVVIMALATSMLAPPLLRKIASAWRGTAEEQERLDREQVYSENLLVRPGRVLLPAQRGDGTLLAAKIVDLAWPSDSPATVIATDPAGASAIGGVCDVFERRPAEQEEVSGVDAGDALTEHVGLGYEVVAVGARETGISADLLSPLTQSLLQTSALPVVVVWAGPHARVQLGEGFRRVLVPVVGTLPNRAAQEIAFSLAAANDTDLVVAHVAPDDADLVAVGADAQRSGRIASRGLVTEASQLARRLGLRPRAVTRAGSRSREIPAIAADVDADLVVLSAELRAAEGTAFLGHLVERMIGVLDATVAVVVTPPGWLLARSEATRASTTPE
jgi:Kef-type K+ transport system membrane component KefB/nucleotide-binding universal stress UspA family protein